MAYGFYIQAEYESGYCHTEDEQDHSPFVRGKNILSDIIEKRPEAAHGKMVRFSLIGADARYDVDFRGLPASARPIYYRDMKATIDEYGNQTTECLKHYFGYQYNDEQGKNIKEIQEI
jgi:hypothetical protein